MAKLGKWALGVCAVALVGCDHATKTLAKETLGGGRVITVLRGWLDLRYAENFDTAFSLSRSWGGSSKALVLTLVAVVTTIGVLALAWQRRRVASQLEHAGLALVAAGAIGNAADRVRRGYVVDFIHLHHWPVFNVADVLIVVGALLLGWSARRSNGQDATPDQAPGGGP